MLLNVGKEVAALRRLTMKELRERYAEVFGEATNANNKVLLIRCIAWRLQARAEGDLSERPTPRRRTGVRRRSAHESAAGEEDEAAALPGVGLARFASGQFLAGLEAGHGERSC